MCRGEPAVLSRASPCPNPAATAAGAAVEGVAGAAQTTVDQGTALIKGLVAKASSNC
jgi:hypothetical protein